MFLRILLATIFCLTASIASADSVSVGFNDDSFQLGYEHPVNNDAYGTAMLNGRFLYNGDEETRLGSLGLDFTGKPGNISGLDLGVGTKIYAGSTDPDIDFINLAIGLRGSYILPQLKGLGVAGRLYYAPKVFSFRDSERLFEAEVRLTYAVLPKVKLYVSYQNIGLDIDSQNDNHTVNDSVRIGFVGFF